MIESIIFIKDNPLLCFFVGLAIWGLADILASLFKLLFKLYRNVLEGAP